MKSIMHISRNGLFNEDWTRKRYKELKFPQNKGKTPNARCAKRRYGKPRDRGGMPNARSARRGYGDDLAVALRAWVPH